MCTAPGDDDGPRPTAAVKEEERTLSAGDGAALREFVALPATGFRRGAVLIIHDIWGYTDFYKDLARRITGHGNASRIRQFPLASPKDTLYAKDVITFARTKGWFKGKDADFSFADTYAPTDFGTRRFCDSRVWCMFNRAAPSQKF